MPAPADSSNIWKAVFSDVLPKGGGRAAPPFFKKRFFYLLHSEGNLDVFTRVAVVINQDSGNLIISSNAIHGISIENDTVQGKYQCIVTSACYLKFNAVTIDQVGCTRNLIIQNAFATPAGLAITAKAGILILRCSIYLFVDNTEASKTLS